MSTKNDNVEKIKMDKSLLEIRLTLFFERNFNTIQNSKSEFENLNLVSKSGTADYNNKEKLIEFYVRRLSDDLIAATQLIKDANKKDGQ